MAFECSALTRTEKMGIIDLMIGLAASVTAWSLTLSAIIFYAPSSAASYTACCSKVLDPNT